MPFVVTIDESALEERFVRASGPGGQNVNKVATAVELRFHIRDSSLPGPVQDRLIQLAGGRVVAGDVLVIDSREHRTQAQNREAARHRLLAWLRKAAAAPKRRRPTAPRPSAVEARLADKKRRGAVKDRRSGTSGEE